MYLALRDDNQVCIVRANMIKYMQKSNSKVEINYVCFLLSLTFTTKICLPVSCKDYYNLLVVLWGLFVLMIVTHCFLVANLWWPLYYL